MLPRQTKSLFTIIMDVAGRHGLSTEALRAKVRRYQASGGRRHGRDLLTDEEEAGVVAFVRAAAAQHMHATPADVIRAVSIVMKKSPDWNGWSWYAGIKKRHPDVFKLRKTKPIKLARVEKDVVEETTRYIEVAGPLIKNGGFPSSAILHADETQLSPLP